MKTTTVTAAFLVALLAFAPAQTPAAKAGGKKAAAVCVLCTGKDSIRCPTCEGKGLVKTRCFYCKGKGDRDCVLCVPLVARAKKGRLKVKRLSRGRLPCTNGYCMGGTVNWKEGGKNRCKVCGGRGHNKCPACKKGRAKCAGCRGKKHIQAVCSTCAGSRTIDCPGCSVSPDRRVCPLCIDRSKLPCARCRSTYGARGPCRACGGLGKEPCASCLGVGKDPCSGCGGCGKVRFVNEYGKSQGVRGCESCKKRGVHDCESCAKGTIDCPRCIKGEVKGDCGRCNLKTNLMCQCVPLGSHAVFLMMGDALQKAGLHARAVRFYEAAYELSQRQVRNRRIKTVGNITWEGFMKDPEGYRASIKKKLVAAREAVKASGAKDGK